MCYINHLDVKLERFERERHALLQLTETERAKEQLRAFFRYKNSPWAFLEDCVYTLDQVSSTSPIKPFPTHLDYLQFLTYIWQKHKLTAYPKSRRMVCSWLMISLYTHDTMFNTGRFNAFVSKKEENAGELVSRAEFIYQHIPTWRIPRELLPKIRSGAMTKKPPVLEFEDIHSKIQGFPQGADQLRQFTLSGILGDECAFWEEAEAFYSASKPTLDGGGRMTLISSRSPGFFKKIVFDKISSKDYNFPEVPPATVKRPVQGVEVWKNPDNGFFIVDLSYDADPAKRSREWEESVRKSLPAWQFEMEYKKSWSAHQGKTVFPDFKKDFHTTKDNIDVEPGLPLLIGVDFGLTPAMVLCQLVGTQLRVIKEFIETNGSIRKLAPVVYNYLSTKYLTMLHNGDVHLYIDPAGVRRSEADENTCMLELKKAGFDSIRPGPVDWESRRAAVERFIMSVTKEGPGLYVSEKGCPLLAEGLNGGYRYPDSYTDTEPDKARPIKDRYSHPADALQYVCYGAISNLKTYKVNLPPPTYSFQRESE